MGLTSVLHTQSCCTCKGRSAGVPEVLMVLKLYRCSCIQGWEIWHSQRGTMEMSEKTRSEQPCRAPFCGLYLHYCSSFEATGCCSRGNGAYKLQSSFDIVLKAKGSTCIKILNIFIHDNMKICQVGSTFMVYVLITRNAMEYFYMLNHRSCRQR